MEEKTYKVTIELEVLAVNEKAALNSAVGYAMELYQDGSLDADIVPLGEEQ